MAGRVARVFLSLELLIAFCKLPPDTDAVSRTIIVPLMQNAGAAGKGRHVAVIKPMRR